ncbi:hypothetical protein ACFSKL_16185 [Belliella marina]|uniref:Uncharacterized protein n=1 Tax=Belliella marina TaxID=1644146 RepID=A0ABW4VQ85_9BACT
MKWNYLMNMFVYSNLLWIISCKNECKNSEIEVSELLEISANERSIDYCGILVKAINGDEKSIKELSLLDFQNAVGYDHGTVIVGLIINVGEMNFIEAIYGINAEQKNMIKAYVDIGLEYGYIRNQITTKETETEFPILHEFLIR